MVTGENESNNYEAVRYNVLKHGILSKHVVLPHRDLMSMTSEELKNREREVIRDLEATGKAEKILFSNRANVYAKAVKTLLPDSWDWWQDKLDDEEVKPSIESLRNFIIRDLIPFCESNLAEIWHHEVIKRQVIGEGIGVLIHTININA